MKQVAGIAVAFALFGGTAMAVPASATAAGNAPAFEEGTCPDEVPRSDRVTCGFVTVPENRDRPKGNEVRLAVAIVHPEEPHPTAAPLLFVSGGPGDAALVNVEWFLETPFVTDRDMIVVDLRGTGASKPSLACPEVAEPLVGVASGNRKARAVYLDQLRACRDRLDRAGVDRRAYDYEAMSADLADLRRALKIDAWHVYGISNGGRLALELVRRHPEGVKSVVLDAALAPDGNFYTELWPHGARAIDALFSACDAQPTCAKAHPDLEQRSFDFVEQLRRDPEVVTTENPSTGQPGTVVFDDISTLEILRGGLYDTSLIPAIPALVEGLIDGSARELVAQEVLARTGPSPTFGLGQSLSDNCREEVAFVKQGELRSQARRMPRYRRVILDDRSRQECGVWDVGKADASFDRPVTSKIPALLLVGSFDPVHPLASAKAIAAHLPNSTVVELPGLGHGTAFAHECARSLMQAFVLDPRAKVDTACVDAMGPPNFT
jgi:pimeloyl-ACP methyl ester carboxylesterase